MPRRLSPLLPLLLALVLLAAALLASAALAGSPGAVVRDPAGDAQGAPDVVSLALSAPEPGQLSFTLALANRPQGLRAGDVVAVLLDSDQDPETGCHGYEWMLSVHDAAAAPRLARCQGGAFVDVSASWSAGYDPASGLATFTVQAADLGSPAAFDVSAATMDGAGHADVAPDERPASYQISDSSPEPGPELVSRDVTPPTARALPAAGRRGSLFRLSFRLADDSGQAAVSLAVYHGRASTPSVSKTFPLHALSGGVYYVSYRSAKPFKGRFCVSATDGAGNKSPVSCARLVVR